jgi:hypothetical protein
MYTNWTKGKKELVKLKTNCRLYHKEAHSKVVDGKDAV